MQGHSVGGFAAMNRMRLHSQLCDVKLRCGLVTLPAHKLVLAATSPYFHAMFNGEQRLQSVQITSHCPSLLHRRHG